MNRAKSKVSGWGNYPKVDACLDPISYPGHLEEALKLSPFIARGLGRSYGDSSLAQNMVLTKGMDRVLAFDPEGGTIKCQSGLSLKELLDIFLPRGWFPPVTPGTKFVTVGGAIASDVHGKNHHKEGSFCRHVTSLELALPDGRTITCSNEENADIFRATCGGMGLTGIIMNAALRLKKVETGYIKQKAIRAASLDEMLELFETNGETTYSVAWLDSSKKGGKLGSGILFLGEHAGGEEVKEIKPFLLKTGKPLSIPFDFPAFFLNGAAIRSLNAVYSIAHSGKLFKSLADYDAFFYPLDGISNWNRIYGKRGFTQYQLVLPKEESREGLRKILSEIRRRGFLSFLTVLKLFGKENNNLLSFPMEGYTLALDFPITRDLFALLNDLDDMVLQHGGRLYLSKDARMGAETFRKSYRNLPEFIKIKDRLDMNRRIESVQSKRLGV